MAVAWEGPGLARSIIDGKYLVPWHAPFSSKHSNVQLKPSTGILREYWTNYSAGNVTSLTSGTTPEGGLTIKGAEITPLQSGVWPKPLHIEPGLPLLPDDIYRWVEGVGSVGFLATDGSSATVELVSDGETVSVKIEKWNGEMPQLRPNMRIKFRGVCEGGQSANSQLIAGFISVQTDKDISFFVSPGINLPVTNPSVAAIPSTDLSPGGYYGIGGVVTFHDRVLGKPCLFIQDVLSGVSVSQAERALDSSIQIGQSIGIGGRVIPGKYGAGVLPHTVNIWGRQNLPTPVIAPDDGTSDNYRDALWTEVSGVAAALNSDGTITLIRKRSSLHIWVGQTDLGALKKLLNCTLRIRGVMSLNTLNYPVLLVPSRNFVETLEPAPIIPLQPVLIASIKKPQLGEGRIHQVKVVGTVTFRDNNGFFIQDDSGSIRVNSFNPKLPEAGAEVNAVGYPQIINQETCLADSTWLEEMERPGLGPVNLDLENLSYAQNHLLVGFEARLLSQGPNGSNRSLELEAGQQVFEAMLQTTDKTLPQFETGSILELTGICVLKPEGSAANDNGSVASVALTKILLRSPLDVRLIEGAPWWTWKRTAILICGLSAVLIGSILRIRLLDRRFLRQQIARREFAREMLKSQESERRRIAASLHDSLGQDLLVIRNQALRAIQSSTEDSHLRQRLEEISSTTQHALDEVREITHNLRPYQLDRLGLTQAIRALTRRISENSSIEFACHVEDIDNLFDAESEIHIYRIVQEGVTNVLKHSNASEATLVIKLGTRHLSISIRDNGKGIHNPIVPAGGGFGLGGMQERCQILLGTIKIDSSPGNGFSLQVEIPIPNPKSK